MLISVGMVIKVILGMLIYQNDFLLRFQCFLWIFVSKTQMLFFSPTYWVRPHQLSETPLVSKNYSETLWKTDWQKDLPERTRWKKSCQLPNINLTSVIRLDSRCTASHKRFCRAIDLACHHPGLLHTIPDFQVSCKLLHWLRLEIPLFNPQQGRPRTFWGYLHFIKNESCKGFYNECTGSPQGMFGPLGEEGEQELGKIKSLYMVGERNLKEVSLKQRQENIKVKIF